MSSPYSILRIRPDATAEEIEEAYYRMRRLISSSNGIKEHEIQNAYATLTDPIRKAVADMQVSKAGTQAATQAAQGAGGNWIGRLLKK